MNNPASSLARKLALAAIMLLIALLMLPNLIWLAYSHVLTTWIAALVLPLALLAALFALLGRWPWLSCLLLAPFALLAPIETYFVAEYHVPSTLPTIATMMATNVPEAWSYLGHLAILAVLLPVTASALSLLAAWWAFRSHLRWTGRLRTWITAIVIATPLVSSAVGFTVANGSISDHARSAELPLATLADAVESGFPFGIVQRYIAYRHAWNQMRSSAAQFKDFSFHARRVDTHVGARQVYVLVIGESSARDHWQLFGYDRRTNPALSQVPDLVPITRMVTAWPDTILAVPLLLTRKPITSHSPDWKEPSFLPAMQEAGFQTWWISNQYPIGQFDSPVAIYAYEAQHVVWVNHSATWNNPGSPDGDIVPALRRALDGSAGDLFIVLHMMGSHMAYDYRYPKAFARFWPTQSDAGGSTPHDVRVRNSYDNTIVYTDHVLTQIIDVLNHSGAVTALWYESDHGEKLPSATCDKNGHGLGTRSEYEIPALFWYSAAYAMDFPQRIAMLRTNANKRSLSASTFETMIDMAGVTFPGRDESWSLFSPKWTFHSRIVSQFWQTDFDHAVVGKKCGILMPADTQTSTH